MCGSRDAGASRDRFPLPIGKKKKKCQDGVSETADRLRRDMPAPLIEVYVKHTTAHRVVFTQEP